MQRFDPIGYVMRRFLIAVAAGTLVVSALAAADAALEPGTRVLLDAHNC